MAARDGYARAAVRTSVRQGVIIKIYETMGFSVVNTQDQVSRKIVDGVEVDASDERVILYGKNPSFRIR